MSKGLSSLQSEDVDFYDLIWAIAQELWHSLDREQNNFDLYDEILEELAGYFFALNHYNYARWFPIHIRDIKSLPHALGPSLNTAAREC